MVRIKLIETLREKMGGTYSPGVGAASTKVPVPQYAVTAYFGSISGERGAALARCVRGDRFTHSRADRRKRTSTKSRKNYCARTKSSCGKTATGCRRSYLATRTAKTSPRFSARMRLW